jgi:hypothetical protein
MTRATAAGLALIAAAVIGARRAVPPLAPWVPLACQAGGRLLAAFGCPSLRWRSLTLAFLFALLSAVTATAPVG